jgi:hypothetical protein
VFFFTYTTISGILAAEARIGMYENYGKIREKDFTKAFFRIPFVAIADGMLTLAAVVGSIAEMPIWGLGNILGAYFSENCDVGRGIGQIIVTPILVCALPLFLIGTVAKVIYIVFKLLFYKQFHETYIKNEKINSELCSPAQAFQWQLDIIEQDVEELEQLALSQIDVAVNIPVHTIKNRMEKILEKVRAVHQKLKKYEQDFKDKRRFGADNISTLLVLNRCKNIYERILDPLNSSDKYSMPVTATWNSYEAEIKHKIPTDFGKLKTYPFLNPYLDHQLGYY